jgi:hypothetical protein
LTQPDEWIKTHQSEKLIPAIFALIFIGFFMLLVLISQIVHSNNLFQSSREENFVLGDIDIDHDQNRTRDSTKAMTLKFGQRNNSEQVRDPNVAPLIQGSNEIHLSNDEIDESELTQNRESS